MCNSWPLLVILLNRTCCLVQDWPEPIAMSHHLKLIILLWDHRYSRAMMHKTLRDSLHSSSTLQNLKDKITGLILGTWQKFHSLWKEWREEALLLVRIPSYLNYKWPVVWKVLGIIRLTVRMQSIKEPLLANLQLPKTLRSYLTRIQGKTQKYSEIILLKELLE